MEKKVKPSPEWLAQQDLQRERTTIKTNAAAEWLVLRAMCISPRYTNLVAEHMTAEMFTDALTSPIAAVIWQMVEDGAGVSLMAFKTFAQRTHVAGDVYKFVEALKGDGDGGGFDTPSLNMAIDDIRNIWTRQNLADVSTMQLTALKSNDLELYNELEQRKDDILAGKKSVVMEAEQVVTEFEENTLKIIAQREAGSIEINGILTGLNALDNYLLGIEAGNLVTVGGRPGMGKTALVTQMQVNLAARGIPMGFISLEMTRGELIRRQTSQVTSIHQNDFKAGLLSDTDKHLWGIFSDKMKKWPMYYDDQSSKWSDISQSVTRMAKQFGCKIVAIDYLQLMDSGIKGNETESIGKLSVWCKRLAKKLGIAIVLISQLSRASETRGGDKRPQMSDLRQSGEIEQNSDIVMFPFRPEYYGVVEDEEGSNLRGKLELIIAKHKGGAVGSVMLEFDGPTNKISDVAGTITNSNETPF